MKRLEAGDIKPSKLMIPSTQSASIEDGIERSQIGRRQLADKFARETY